MRGLKVFSLGNPLEEEVRLVGGRIDLAAIHIYHYKQEKKGQVKREPTTVVGIAPGTTNYANFADFAADFDTFPKI